MRYFCEMVRSGKVEKTFHRLMRSSIESIKFLLFWKDRLFSVHAIGNALILIQIKEATEILQLEELYW